VIKFLHSLHLLEMYPNYAPAKRARTKVPIVTNLATNPTIPL